MADDRMKDINWRISKDGVGADTIDHCLLAVLMDLRDELKKLNELLHCNKFLSIPKKLSRIAYNTTKKRRK